jgi:hypothetical protein
MFTGIGEAKELGGDLVVGVPIKKTSQKYNEKRPQEEKSRKGRE